MSVTAPSSPAHPMHKGQRPWRIGLTGGMGSGKSTVAAFLLQSGCAVVDADALSRASTAAGGAAMAAIEARFGPAFLTSERALDRQAMREHVFAHPEAKAQLEAVIHPIVMQGLEQHYSEAAQAGRCAVIFDIPLLAESAPRWRPRLDRIWVIDCTRETQIARVVARNGLAPAMVESILAQQATRAERLALADAVIVNEGIDLATLRQSLGPLLDALPGMGPEGRL